MNLPILCWNNLIPEIERICILMTKLLSSLLVIFLILSVSSFAFAEDSTVSYSWDSVVGVIAEAFPDSSTYWLVEEVDAVFWLPDAYISQELTAEDQENNAVGCFLSESGNSLIYLTYSDEGLTLDTYYAALIQSGYDVEKVTVNKIPAVIFRSAENNALFLIYQTQQGKLFQIMFTGYLDENLSAIYDLVISSIQPRVEEVSEEPVSSVNPVSGLISK